MLLLTTALFLSGLAPALIQSVTAQTARTLTFANKCGADVWLSPTTGAAGMCAAGCPSGSTCSGKPSCYLLGKEELTTTWRRYQEMVTAIGIIRLLVRGTIV